MPGLVPGIHVLRPKNSWMAGTSPAMTVEWVVSAREGQHIDHAQGLQPLRRLWIVPGALRGVARGDGRRDRGGDRTEWGRQEHADAGDLGHAAEASRRA